MNRSENRPHEAQTRCAVAGRAWPFGRCRSAGRFIALVLLLPLLAHASCHVETMELPVTIVDSRATIAVGINGTPVALTVDSGAPFNTLTEGAAAQLGLYANPNAALHLDSIAGAVPLLVTTVERLALPKGELKREDFLIGGNEPGAGTVGFLGRSILSRADTEYDLAHGMIRLMFPNDDCAHASMAYWAGTTPVVEVDLLSHARELFPSAIRAHASLNGSDLVVLLDTGATSTVVTVAAARRAGIADADLQVVGTASGMGRKRVALSMARFEKFELGDEAMLRNRLRVGDFDVDGADMLLGIDFFLSHRIYVSRQQSKMFITYNGGPVFGSGQRSDARAEITSGDASAGPDQSATADGFARRGAASAARHDYESALADLNRACELAPASATDFAQRAGIQEALQHPEKALQDYDAALSRDSGQAAARLRRALLRRAARDLDGAKTDLDALDATLAPQAPMRLTLANLYIVLGYPSQAVVQLDEWLLAHPREFDRDVALNARCRARLMLWSELDRALDDCDGAVDGDAKNPEYLAARGWAHLRLGDARDALTDFDRSVQYRPQDAASLYGRGLAETRLGDASRGDTDLAAARRLRPTIEADLARGGLTTVFEKVH